jgi:hypothetical protein
MALAVVLVLALLLILYENYPTTDLSVVSRTAGCGLSSNVWGGFDFADEGE